MLLWKHIMQRVRNFHYFVQSETAYILDNRYEKNATTVHHLSELNSNLAL